MCVYKRVCVCVWKLNMWKFENYISDSVYIVNIIFCIHLSLIATYHLYGCYPSFSDHVHLLQCENTLMRRINNLRN